MKRCLLCLALCFSCTGSAVAQAPAPAPNAPQDALGRMNRGFHGLYLQGKAAALARSGPVIVSLGDGPLTLVHNGTSRSTAYSPALADKLKAMSHLPLALVVAVEGSDRTGTVVLPADTRRSLEAFRNALGEARAALADEGFTPEQAVRQDAIAQATANALEAVLATPAMSRDDFLAFTKRTTPWIMANVTDAAQLQLAALNTLVGKWQGEVGESWKDLRVVVAAPHMPRAGQLQWQYFARLLHEEGEHRLFYAENVGTTQGALDLLATHLLDGAASRVFFDDPQRLHRDILADAAAAHISSLEMPRFP